jgi:hypothetical protein
MAKKCLNLNKISLFYWLSISLIFFIQKNEEFLDLLAKDEFVCKSLAGKSQVSDNLKTAIITLINV